MGMTVSEALMMGLTTTVLGLAIVFGVLVILMLVLMLFKVIFYKEPEKQQEKPVKKKVTPQIDKPVEQTLPKQEDDEELIAVFASAIAASLDTSTYNLRIKSYKRVDTKSNAWTNAGIRENISNKTY